MRKLMKAGLLCASALMLVTGCAKKASETEKATASEATASEAAEETKEHVEGELKSLAEYKGVAVEIPEVPEITDENVETQIQQELDSNPEEIVITDRGAEDGDTVNIDFKGYKDGEAFDGGEGTDYDLVLGSGSFIDGFEDGLIGAKAGEKRELDLTFPEDYGQEDLAGADVVFEVTVNEVKSEKPAELNDAFVQRVSDFKTVDEYRADIRKKLEDGRQMMIENYTGTQVMNNLIENSDIICDSDKVDDAFETQRANFENQIGMYGMTIDSYLTMAGMTADEYEKQLRDAAEIAVKQEMILDEISERENIKADDTGREKVANMYGETVDSLKAVIGEKQMDKMALMQNTLDFLCANADVTVVETTAAAETESDEETESAAEGESAEETAADESTSEFDE